MSLYAHTRTHTRAYIYIYTYDVLPAGLYLTRTALLLPHGSRSSCSSVLLSDARFDSHLCFLQKQKSTNCSSQILHAPRVQRSHRYHRLGLLLRAPVVTHTRPLRRPRVARRLQRRFRSVQRGSSFTWTPPPSLSLSVARSSVPTRTR